MTTEYAGLNTTKDDQEYQKAVKQGTSAVPSVLGSAGYISNPSSLQSQQKRHGGSLQQRLAEQYAKKPEKQG